MNKVSPILTPLRWYEKFHQQDRFDKNCPNNCDFKLITDRGHMLPFQLTRPASGYFVTKWLLRSACIDAETKILTEKDSKFFSSNSWINNGNFTFDCSVAKSGIINGDELNLNGLLTIGKTYKVSFSVPEFSRVVDSELYLTFNQGATIIIDDILNVGYYEAEFVATSTDVAFVISASGTFEALTDFVGITDVQIIQTFEASVTDVELNETDITLVNFGSTDQLVFCGTFKAPLCLPIGDYYMIIQTGEANYYSEVITIKSFVPEKSPYYKLEWYNSCDIDDTIYNEDSINCLYKNRIYLDESILTKPEYPFREEGEVDGTQKFNVTFQVWEKTIRFLIAKCPEFIVDALTGIRLHDTFTITTPLRNKQLSVDDAITIQSVEADVQPVDNDCWTNVELKLLLEDRYVDSSCCTNSTPEVCAECTYNANYYNELPETETAEYALITDAGVDTVGLYIWSIIESLWKPVTLEEDDLVCFGDDTWRYASGVLQPLVTIADVVYAFDSYFVTGFAFPGSYVQLETSSDGGTTWTPRTPIESWSVFELIGIQIVAPESDLLWRAKCFTLSCEYETSPIFGWTPTLLNKLLGWYKSDIGITESGGLVSQWKDQSVNGYHLNQSTGADKPLLTAGELNGFPAIVFDGVSDRMSVAFVKTQPVTVFIVYKKNDALKGYITDGGADLTANIIHDTAGEISLYAGSSGFPDTVVLPQDAYGLLIATFNGVGSKTQRHNGATTTGAAGGFDSDGFTIGGKCVTSTEFANISVAEIILSDNNCSDEDRKEVRGYIRARYKI